MGCFLTDSMIKREALALLQMNSNYSYFYNGFDLVNELVIINFSNEQRNLTLDDFSETILVPAVDKLYLRIKEEKGKQEKEDGLPGFLKHVCGTFVTEIRITRIIKEYELAYQLNIGLKCV